MFLDLVLILLPDLPHPHQLLQLHQPLHLQLLLVTTTHLRTQDKVPFVHHHTKGHIHKEELLMDTEVLWEDSLVIWLDILLKDHQECHTVDLQDHLANLVNLLMPLVHLLMPLVHMDIQDQLAEHLSMLG